MEIKRFWQCARIDARFFSVQIPASFQVSNSFSTQRRRQRVKCHDREQYREKETYQKTYGGIYSDGVNALLFAAGYQQMSNADKAALLTSVEDYARDMAKQAVAPGSEVKSSTTKANEAEDSAGLSPVEYLLAAAQINQYNADGKGNIRQDEITDALDALDLEDWQKAGLWALIGSNWKPEKNPYT